jgi:hypothetical protein
LGFTATNTSTLVSILGTQGGSTGNYIGLDNVSLLQTSAAPVPGPIVGAGLPGLAMAFGGLGVWWRRRKALTA